MTDRLDKTNEPDWEGVARHLLATELRERSRQLEDHTIDVAETLEEGGDITEDELEHILGVVEEYWYYVEHHLVAVSVMESLPEPWSKPWD